MSESRASILREMGLTPRWRLRNRIRAEGPDALISTDPSDKVTDHVAAAVLIGREVAPNLDNSSGEHVSGRLEPVTKPEPVSVSQPARTLEPVISKKATKQPVATVAASDVPRVGRIEQLPWDELEQDMRACEACGLCAQRRQVVPGIGDRTADWMLVGEGPGAEEDRRGEPFVGQAGKLLDAMLHAIGLERSQGVYITNAVKCRPPMNRTPQADEVSACLPYLARQIELVQPKLLLALGRPAAQALLRLDIKINAARGRLFDYRGIPVIVTYHPAYLLRNPADKAKAWEDLCFAQDTMATQLSA